MSKKYFQKSLIYLFVFSLLIGVDLKSIGKVFTLLDPNDTGVKFINNIQLNPKLTYKITWMIKLRLLVAHRKC